jgi:septal ring factor EnvC (AmiA/AmiB activator)
MTINDEILILANQLANAGNKPTVALIKAKLTKKVALPVIISTLKAWQHQPNFISKAENTHSIIEKNNEAEDTGAFRQKLNDELAQIKQEIVELKQMIIQLINLHKNY